MISQEDSSVFPNSVSQFFCENEGSELTKGIHSGLPQIRESPSLGGACRQRFFEVRSVLFVFETVQWLGLDSDETDLRLKSAF